MKRYSKTLIGVIIIGAISVGAYYYVKSNKNDQSETKNNTSDQNTNNNEQQGPQSSETEKTLPKSSDQLSGNSAQALTKDGDISIGQITPVNVSQIQNNVDAGNQPWRTDPLQVAQADGGDYGFTLSDDYNFLGESNGVAKIKITHQSKNYIVELIQPDKKGASGIWLIDKISTE